MAETKEKLMAELMVWKNHMEAKGLRFNVSKTKVMRSKVESGPLEKSGKWPCATCLKSVGANSIKCKEFKQWVHKRCSGITEALKGVVGFKCDVCRGKVISLGVHPETLSIDGVGIFEWVNKFSYVGDMIGVGGGCEKASRARLRGARCKFRELAPILTKRGASLM